MKKPRIGYSRLELRSAGLTFDTARSNGIVIDLRRKSCLDGKVNELIKLALPKNYTHTKIEPVKKSVSKPSVVSKPKVKKIVKPKAAVKKVEKPKAAVKKDEKPSLQEAVKNIFEKVPLYEKKGDLINALEQYVVPIANMPANALFDKLKDEEIINYSRAKPRGYSLG